MKACWMVCLVTALSATSAWAESPLQSLQFEQQKQQVLKAVKEKCAPASHLSDNDFANKVLATDGNKNAVREAPRHAGFSPPLPSLRCAECHVPPPG